MPASLRKKKYQRLVEKILGLSKQESSSKDIALQVKDRIDTTRDTEDNRINKKRPDYDFDYRKA